VRRNGTISSRAPEENKAKAKTKNTKRKGKGKKTKKMKKYEDRSEDGESTACLHYNEIYSKSIEGCVSKKCKK